MLTPILAPVLAIILAADPLPTGERGLNIRPDRAPSPSLIQAASSTSLATAVAGAARIPGVGQLVSLYRGPIQPKVGYGSRPKKHVKVGVSVAF